jgi:hypothetical protein
MRKILGPFAFATVIGLATSVQAQVIIRGNDEKPNYNDAGQMTVSPPGKDPVSIIDIGNRAQPRILATLPLMDSVS